MTGIFDSARAGATGGRLGARFGGNLRAAALSHREGDPDAAMSRMGIRFRVVLILLVNFFISCCGFLLAAVDDVPFGGRVVAASFGVFWLITSLLLLRGWSLRPTARRLLEASYAEGQPALAIGMNPHRQWEALWLSGGVTVLCIALSIVLYLEAPESVLAVTLLFTGPLVLLLLPVSVDMLLAALKGGEVLLTPTHLRVHSWFSTAETRWETVDDVSTNKVQHGTLLLVQCQTENLQHRTSVFPWHQCHREHLLVIDLDAVEPHGLRLSELLDRLRRYPHFREHIGGQWMMNMLDPSEPLRQ